MAEKEETITVAVRLPQSWVMELREICVGSPEYRNMSDFMRKIVADYLRVPNA